MLPVCLALLGIQEGIQTRVADRLTHERGWTQERKQTHEVDWLTHHHNQEGTPAHKVEWLAFEHSLTQDGTYSRGQNKVYICDPLSENPAHPAFYENRDKTGNRCIDVQLSSIEKMETIGCLVPELRSETHRGRGTQVSRKRNVFTLLR